MYLDVFPSRSPLPPPSPPNKVEMHQDGWKLVNLDDRAIGYRLKRCQGPGVVVVVDSYYTQVNFKAK